MVNQGIVEEEPVNHMIVSLDENDNEDDNDDMIRVQIVSTNNHDEEYQDKKNPLMFRTTQSMDYLPHHRFLQDDTTDEADVGEGGQQPTTSETAAGTAGDDKGDGGPEQCVISKQVDTGFNENEDVPPFVGILFVLTSTTNVEIQSLEIDVRTFEDEIKDIDEETRKYIEVYMLDDEFAEQGDFLNYKNNPFLWTLIFKGQGVTTSYTDRLILPTREFKTIRMNDNERISLYITMKVPLIDHNVNALQKTGEFMTNARGSDLNLLVGSGLSEYYFPKEINPVVDPQFAGVIYYEKFGNCEELVTTTYVDYLYIFSRSYNDLAMVNTVNAAIDEALKLALDENESLLEYKNQYQLSIQGNAGTDMLDFNGDCPSEWKACTDFYIRTRIGFQHEDILSPEALLYRLYSDEIISIVTSAVSNSIARQKVQASYLGLQSLASKYDITLYGITAKNDAEEMDQIQSDYFKHTTSEFLNTMIKKELAMNMDVIITKQQIHQNRRRRYLRGLLQDRDLQEDKGNGAIKISGQIHGGRYSFMTVDEFDKTIGEAFSLKEKEYLEMLSTAGLRPGPINTNNRYKFFTNVYDFSFRSVFIDQGTKSNGSNTTAIVAVVGVLGGIIAIVGMFYFHRWLKEKLEQKKHRKEYRKQRAKDKAKRKEEFKKFVEEQGGVVVAKKPETETQTTDDSPESTRKRANSIDDSVSRRSESEIVDGDCWEKRPGSRRPSADLVNNVGGGENSKSNSRQNSGRDLVNGERESRPGSRRPSADMVNGRSRSRSRERGKRSNSRDRPHRRPSNDIKDAFDKQRDEAMVRRLQALGLVTKEPPPNKDSNGPERGVKRSNSYDAAQSRRNFSLEEFIRDTSSSEFKPSSPRTVDGGFARRAPGRSQSHDLQGRGGALHEMRASAVGLGSYLNGQPIPADNPASASRTVGPGYESESRGRSLAREAPDGRGIQRSRSFDKPKNNVTAGPRLDWNAIANSYVDGDGDSDEEETPITNGQMHRRCMSDDAKNNTQNDSRTSRLVMVPAQTPTRAPQPRLSFDGPRGARYINHSLQENEVPAPPSPTSLRYQRSRSFDGPRSARDISHSLHENQVPAPPSPTSSRHQRSAVTGSLDNFIEKQPRPMPNGISGAVTVGPGVTNEGNHGFRADTNLLPRQASGRNIMRTMSFDKAIMPSRPNTIAESHPQGTSEMPPVRRTPARAQSSPIQPRPAPPQRQPQHEGPTASPKRVAPNFGVGNQDTKGPITTQRGPPVRQGAAGLPDYLQQQQPVTSGKGNQLSGCKSVGGIPVNNGRAAPFRSPSTNTMPAMRPDLSAGKQQPPQRAMTSDNLYATPAPPSSGKLRGMAQNNVRQAPQRSMSSNGQAPAVSLGARRPSPPYANGIVPTAPAPPSPNRKPAPLGGYLDGQRKHAGSANHSSGIKSVGGIPSQKPTTDSLNNRQRRAGRRPRTDL